MEPKNLKITLVKSKICTLDHHRGTLRSLGLRKIRQSVIRQDSPELRGMLRTVDFMIEVEEVK